jgi:putative ABC transport system ATP-binding protein
LSWGTSKAERDKYKEMLKQLDLGLEGRLSAKVKLLSGGQRQALTLMMATLKQPKMLLLDEHTAALDPKTGAKVLSLTEELVAENNLTTMMITHNMRDAIKYGNRLLMLHEGRIIVDISGEDKNKLQVEDLLHLFEQASGSQLDNDRMLLS